MNKKILLLTILIIIFSSFVSATNYTLGQYSGTDLFTGGIASTSNYYTTFTADKAFDNSLSTRWLTDLGTVPQWIQYDFGVGNCAYGNVLNLRMQEIQDFEHINIKKSNSTSTWAYETGTLTTYNSSVVGGEWQYFTFDDDECYRYIRMDISDYYDSTDYSIYEMELIYDELLFVTISNFSITAVSNWSGISINNFSADIDGVGIFNTTNGTIITNLLTNDTNLYNITFFSEEWFNKTYEDYNISISGDLTGELFQTDITFNFKFSSGDLVPTDINLTRLDTNETIIVENGNINIFPDSGVQEWHVESINEVFEHFNISINFTVLENETYNFTVNESLNTLTFNDANSGLPIEDAEVLVVYPNSYNITLTTNSTGQINFSYVLNDSTEFGTYNFSFTKLGYLPFNFSEIINESNIPFSATYNISRANLTINVYNRSTGLLLTGVNVTINFVGLFNETITNGTLTKNNLTIMSDEYSIFVSSDGYRTEKRIFDFSNQESLEIDFYLLSLDDPNAGILTATTSDNYYRQISGVPVDLLEYKEDELSFVSVSQCITNANGECDFLVELNTKVYYLRAVTTVDGVVYVADTNTDGEIFTSSGIIRNLIFQISPEFVIDGISNLIYSISETFVNNISSISVSFINSDGTNVEVCVEYFKKSGGSYTSVTDDTYCLTASSAVQNINTNVLLNRSNTYKASVYIKQTSGNVVLKEYFYSSVSSADELFGDDIISALIMIFWISSLAFSLYAKNINLWFYIAITLSWLEVIIFPLFTIVAVSVLKTIISLATLFVSRKVRDLQ